MCCGPTASVIQTTDPVIKHVFCCSVLKDALEKSFRKDRVALCAWQKTKRSWMRSFVMDQPSQGGENACNVVGIYKKS